MFSTVPFVALLALSVTGSPVEVRNTRISLPITRRLKFSNGTNQVQHGEARVDDLKFHIGDQTYLLTRNAQIWPRYINYKINGLDSGIYLAVKSLSTPVGYGNDFRLGYVFLQRFYTAFDIAGSRVGFARTPFTDATTN